MSDYKLTATGKLLFTSIIGLLNGAKSFVKVKATPEQARALVDAILAMKEYEDAKKDTSATIETIIEKMRKKNLAAAEFKKVIGKPFPL